MKLSTISHILCQRDQSRQRRKGRCSTCPIDFGVRHQCGVKKKKSEQKQTFKMMESLKAEKKKLEATVAEEKRAADAGQVAEAFLKSGKTVKEALALLE